jgi:hypothetical protein
MVELLSNAVSGNSKIREMTFAGISYKPMNAPMLGIKPINL